MAMRLRLRPCLPRAQQWLSATRAAITQPTEEHMRTLGIVALVALAQVAVSFALIRADTGGSFVGLGVLLLAMTFC